MSIATEIARIDGAKADIKSAVASKGINIPNNALINEYASYIGAIPTHETEVRQLIEKSMTSFIVPDGTTSIQVYMFSQCYNLLSITIPNTVTRIYASAFSRSSSLDNVVIPNSVTDMGSSVFYMCSGLTNIKLSDNQPVCESYQFQKCTSLAHITLPASIYRLRTQVFDGCTSLEWIELKSITPPTIVADTFSGLPNDTIIYVPDGSVNAYKSATNWINEAGRIHSINELNNANI